MANLGIKENYENFLKKSFKESLEFGREMTEEDLKLLRKLGMNPDELKEGVKPIHKDLNEDQFAEVLIFPCFFLKIAMFQFFLKENEGKFSFSQKTPKTLKEMDAIVNERTQKLQEALKTSKDDTLLSSDEEVAESKSDDEVAEAKQAEKEVKEINDEPLEEGEARLSDQEEAPENEDEKYETENLEEKRRLNKMTYGNRYFKGSLLKGFMKPIMTK